MKLLNLKKQKQSKGFTLVEILLVVGFIALAGVGIYATYNKVQLSNQVNVETRNIDTITAGIKGLYGSRSSYNGLSNTVINQAKITPESMRDAAVTSILHQFGGTVVVTSIADGAEGATPGKADGSFQIVYNGIPSEVCVKLASSTGVKFDRVKIGANDVKALNAEIDPAEVAKQCAAGPTVAMTFISK